MHISSRAVPTNPSRRSRVLVLLLLVGLLALPITSTDAQTTAECRNTSDETPEDFGPTDISAVSGNQAMAAAFNPDATVTVLKWPSPSYYDQLNLRTTDRSKPRLGALPNEGAFLGLGYKKGSRPWAFEWLRRWRSKQRFADDDGDEVVTTFINSNLGLRVTVRDVVAHDEDVLTRSVLIRKTSASKVTRVRVLSFANFNPVFSKNRRSPTNDWCNEEDEDDGAMYDEKADAIVHARSGTDSSTGQPSGAALVMGFDGRSQAHQVGPDTYEGGGGEGSAYDDAEDARLSGADVSSGPTDAAIAQERVFGRKATVASTVLIAAAFTPDEAVSSLTQIRSRSAGSVRRAKRTWWERWLRSTRLPKNAPNEVMALAKRSLISARQVTDRGGLIVTSVATQSPQGVDWIRNGAYINRMLQTAGHPGMVRAHNIRYAELQATSVRKPLGGETTPPGNWAQNYYADGVVAGPLPYEIDETGFGIWTLWDHYAATGDEDYLDRVYEAIQRAAVYLTDDAPLGCRDTTTGLQCPAHEEDGPEPSRTLVGAQAVWLGLDAAVKAARELGTETSKQNAERWRARRDELGAAIKANFFDETCGCYTRDHQTGGTFLWPVRFAPYGSKISDAQAAINWRHVARAVRGRLTRGGQESRALLGNAYAWAGRPRKMELVKRGLRWVAEIPTTDDTGLLGEAWMRFPNENSKVITMVSQPHVWGQAMFYLAAMKAYGSEPWAP